MRCSVLGPTAPTPSSSLVSSSGLSLSGSSLTYAALVNCRLLFLSARVHQEVTEFCDKHAKVVGNS